MTGDFVMIYGKTVFRVTKLRKRTANLWHVEGHRWIASRQAFSTNVTGSSAETWSPAEWGYVNSDNIVWMRDERPAKRADILKKYGK